MPKEDLKPAINANRQEAAKKGHTNLIHNEENFRLGLEAFSTILRPFDQQQTGSKELRALERSDEFSRVSSRLSGVLRKMQEFYQMMDNGTYPTLDEDDALDLKNRCHALIRSIDLLQEKFSDPALQNALVIAGVDRTFPEFLNAIKNAAEADENIFAQVKEDTNIRSLILNGAEIEKRPEIDRAEMMDGLTKADRFIQDTIKRLPENAPLALKREMESLALTAAEIQTKLKNSHISDPGVYMGAYLRKRNDVMKRAGLLGENSPLCREIRDALQNKLLPQLEQTLKTRQKSADFLNRIDTENLSKKANESEKAMIKSRGSRSDAARYLIYNELKNIPEEDLLLSGYGMDDLSADIRDCEEHQLAKVVEQRQTQDNIQIRLEDGAFSEPLEYRGTTALFPNGKPLESDLFFHSTNKKGKAAGQVKDLDVNLRGLYGALRIMINQRPGRIQALFTENPDDTVTVHLQQVIPDAGKLPLDITITKNTPDYPADTAPWIQYLTKALIAAQGMSNRETASDLQWDRSLIDQVYLEDILDQILPEDYIPHDVKAFELAQKTPQDLAKQLMKDFSAALKEPNGLVFCRLTDGPCLLKSVDEEKGSMVFATYDIMTRTYKEDVEIKLDQLSQDLTYSYNKPKTAWPHLWDFTIYNQDPVTGRYHQNSYDLKDLAYGLHDRNAEILNEKAKKSVSALDERPRIQFNYNTMYQGSAARMGMGLFLEHLKAFNTFMEKKGTGLGLTDRQMNTLVKGMDNAVAQNALNDYLYRSEELSRTTGPGWIRQQNPKTAMDLIEALKKDPNKENIRRFLTSYQKEAAKKALELNMDPQILQVLNKEFSEFIQNGEEMKLPANVPANVPTEGDAVLRGVLMDTLSNRNANLAGHIKAVAAAPASGRENKVRFTVNREEVERNRVRAFAAAIRKEGGHSEEEVQQRIHYPELFIQTATMEPKEIQNRIAAYSRAFKEITDRLLENGSGISEDQRKQIIESRTKAQTAFENADSVKSRDAFIKAASLILEQISNVEQLGLNEAEIYSGLTMSEQDMNRLALYGQLGLLKSECGSMKDSERPEAKENLAAYQQVTKQTIDEVLKKKTNRINFLNLQKDAGYRDEKIKDQKLANELKQRHQEAEQMIAAEYPALTAMPAGEIGMLTQSYIKRIRLCSKNLNQLSSSLSKVSINDPAIREANVSIKKTIRKMDEVIKTSPQIIQKDEMIGLQIMANTLTEISMIADRAISRSSQSKENLKSLQIESLAILQDMKGQKEKLKQGKNPETDEEIKERIAALLLQQYITSSSRTPENREILQQALLNSEDWKQLQKIICEEPQFNEFVEEYDKDALLHDSLIDLFSIDVDEKQFGISIVEKFKANRKIRPEEPKKEEPKKEEPKKEAPKKEEPKKEEPKEKAPKQVEQKREAPKQVEPQKVEPQKEEPQKVELQKEEQAKEALNPEEVSQLLETEIARFRLTLPDNYDVYSKAGTSVFAKNLLNISQEFGEFIKNPQGSVKEYMKGFCDRAATAPADYLIGQMGTTETDKFKQPLDGQQVEDLMLYCRYAFEAKQYMNGKTPEAEIEDRLLYLLAAADYKKILDTKKPDENEVDYENAIINLLDPDNLKKDNEYRKDAPLFKEFVSKDPGSLSKLYDEQLLANYRAAIQKHENDLKEQQAEAERKKIREEDEQKRQKELEQKRQEELEQKRLKEELKRQEEAEKKLQEQKRLQEESEKKLQEQKRLQEELKRLQEKDEQKHREEKLKSLQEKEDQNRREEPEQKHQDEAEKDLPEDPVPKKPQEKTFEIPSDKEDKSYEEDLRKGDQKDKELWRNIEELQNTFKHNSEEREKEEHFQNCYEKYVDRLSALNDKLHQTDHTFKDSEAYTKLKTTLNQITNTLKNSKDRIDPEADPAEKMDTLGRYFMQIKDLGNTYVTNHQPGQGKTFKDVKLSDSQQKRLAVISEINQLSDLFLEKGDPEAVSYNKKQAALKLANRIAIESLRLGVDEKGICRKLLLNSEYQKDELQKIIDGPVFRKMCENLGKEYTGSLKNKQVDNPDKTNMDFYRSLAEKDGKELLKAYNKAGSEIEKQAKKARNAQKNQSRNQNLNKNEKTIGSKQ